MSDSRVQAIIDFWFGPSLVDGFPEQAWTDLWFRASLEHDWQIYRRFQATFQQALQGQLEDWAETAQGRLALILLLDQFPRHLFRHTTHAYGSDAEALRHCREAMAMGQDLALEPCHRLFLYAPLEHCEDLGVQQEAVANIEAFQASQSEAVAKRLESFVHWIRVHRDVIETYGRFPWRNRALGRLNSPEEQRYLSNNPPYLGQW